MSRRRQSFLHGAVILGAATLIVKLVGAFFKIPLLNLIGGIGMSDFSMAYNIFQPLNALAVAGLPVAVSKLVSESTATGRFRDARRILRLCRALFLITGTLGAAVMLLNADGFARMLGSPDSRLTIAALAPAVFFCCMMSSYRGYYQGLKNMYPTALSQVVEAVAKVAGGIGLGVLFMRAASENLDTPGGWADGMFASTQRQVVVEQFGAVGAVLGVTLSTAAGFLFLWFRHHLSGDGISREELEHSPAPAGRRVLLRKMVQIAVPVCLGSVAVHLTTMIDLGSILNRLDYAMRLDSAAVMGGYRGLLPEGCGQAELPKFLYGCYSGIAVNIFNLVPSLTTVMGVSILPAVAGAWAQKRRDQARRNIESALRVTAMISFPAGLGLMALAGPITALLYGARPYEAAIAASLLRSLGLPAIFVSLTTPINSILQAVGEMTAPVKLLVLGGLLKLSVNFLLVGIPEINIQGAPVGTFLCYLLIVLLSLNLLSRRSKIGISYGSVFGKPLFAAACCAAAAWASEGLLSRFLRPSPVVTLAAIALGALCYLTVLLCSRALKKEDVLMLPKGEKVAKILEKHSMIG